MPRAFNSPRQAMRQLFIGGTRSGKSRLAEQAAVTSGRKVIYLATATALDAEMEKRIAEHRARRPDDWRLIEEPLTLAKTLVETCTPGNCLLVDCLTLWLNNVLAESEEYAAQAVADLMPVLPELPGEIIFVSSEIGLGIMPANALARRYADMLGELNQSIAERCDRVTLAVAGLPNVLKDLDTTT